MRNDELTANLLPTTISIPGHKPECMCAKCCDADFANHLHNVLGVNSAKYSKIAITTGEERPYGNGNGTGNGGSTRKPAYFNKPTEPQENFWKLLVNRKHSPEVAAEMIKTYEEGGLEELDKAGMSKYIDTLKSMKDYADRAPKPVAAKREIAPVTEGFYMLNGLPVKVVRGAKGYLYAKLWDNEIDGFESYSKGIISRITVDMKMTVEQAKAFGKEFSPLYGTCFMCGRKLTDEQSIADGVGPICSGRL